MQYLLLIYNNESAAPGPASPEMAATIKDYGAFTESIQKSGHLKGSNALQPVATATSVRVRDGKTLTMTVQGTDPTGKEFHEVAVYDRE